MMCHEGSEGHCLLRLEEFRHHHMLLPIGSGIEPIANPLREEDLPSYMALFDDGDYEDKPLILKNPTKKDNA